jgi:hypothetical protein
MKENLLEFILLPLPRPIAFETDTDTSKDHLLAAFKVHT